MDAALAAIIADTGDAQRWATPRAVRPHFFTREARHEEQIVDSGSVAVARPTLRHVRRVADRGPRGGRLTPKEAAEIGIDVYVYGYPLVTMEYTRRVMTNVTEPKDNHATMERFYNARTYPDAKFLDSTAPNADTLYSTAWMDPMRMVITRPGRKG